jgi:hypothetical protein
MDFTIYQVIAFLNQLNNKNRKFRRVGDEDFIIYKGHLGDLLMKVGDVIKPLPLFNYIIDRWELIEECP